MNLKIAIVCVGFPSVSETFILNQIIEFIRQGHHVDIFPYYSNSFENAHGNITKYNLKENVFPNIIPSKNKLKRLAKAILLCILNFRHISRIVQTLNPQKFKKDALSLKVFYNSLQFIRRPYYDLYIAHFGETAIDLVQLKQAGIVKGRILTCFHGYDLHHSKKHLNSKRISYKNLFLLGDAFIANSSYALKLLRNLGAPESRTMIVPVGLETSRYNGTVRSQVKTEITIVSIGRLIPLKGHIYGIEAINALINKYDIDCIKYLIVGSGEQSFYLANEIIKLGLTKSVHLYGSASQEEVIDILKKADIFLHTSIADRDLRQETQGLVIQEAQAAGLPIVAFNSGGVAEGIPFQTGILVEQKDVEGLTRALYSLIENPKKRITMGEAGITWVNDNYNISLLNKRLLKAACL